MKPGRLLLLLSIVLISIVIYFNKCATENSSLKPGSGAGKPAAPLTVSATIVSHQSLNDQIFASGTLLANNEVELRNELSGRLVKLGFKEGSTVKKGELLVKIDDQDLQAQLRKLMVDKELAEKNENRQKDLLDIKGISQQEYDVALNTLNKIKADIDFTTAQIGKSEIHAPFNGVVGLRTVSEGSYLPANTRIATLQEVDPMKLEFSIPEKYFSRFGQESEIHFTVESTPGLFTGKVYAYEPKIDPATRSLTLRAICSNSRRTLLPGAFAKIVVPLEKQENAVMIPSQSVIPELKGHKVFTVRSGKAFPVKVKLGLRNDTTVQILDGIHVGDTVITTGIMQMRPEMPVKTLIK